MKLKRDISSYLVLIFALIISSPIFLNYGITGKYVALLLIFTWGCEVFFLKKEMNYIKHLAFCLVATVGFGLITAFHYISVTYIFILMIYMGYSFFFCVIDESALNDFTDIASKFIFILEIGALLGFIYAYIGGKPIYSISNIDGRPNFLYLTTFTNARLGNFIRPSGIYDEPGAFSFFIISIVIMRIYYKKNSTFSFVILTLGMITTSLTHFLCMIILLIPILRTSDKKQRLIIYIFFAIMICLMFYFFYDLFDKFLFERLKIDSSTGTIKGNSRNGQIEGCIKSIKENGFLFGNYSLGPEEVIRRYGVISENPLSLLALGGLFNSIPYYCFLFISFTAFLVSFDMCYLAALALFLQRPYQSAIGYSFFFIFFLLIAVNEIKNFMIKKRFFFCYGGNK